ncbi:hypothetical protein L596_007390 [Steinernema carpocapsae]|uniref:Uncharacterized protein n=1 Tax=Steinernema carpocapsae TaxID=34508 RepID=A0A4U5P9T5_STECR|nr:hypothetical protein L596_007390 [Steinernema carpocapsae]
MRLTFLQVSVDKRLFKIDTCTRLGRWKIPLINTEKESAVWTSDGWRAGSREPTEPDGEPAGSAREPGYVIYVKRGRKRLLSSNVQSGRPDGRSTIWVKGAMGAPQFSNCERLAVLSWTDKHAVILPVTTGEK